MSILIGHTPHSWSHTLAVPVTSRPSPECHPPLPATLHKSWLLGLPRRTGQAGCPTSPPWPTSPHAFACADPGSKEYAALDRPGKEAALQAAVAAYETAMAQAEAAAKVGILYEGVHAYMRWKERCEGGVCSCGVQGMSPIKLRACHGHALLDPYPLLP